MVGFEPKPSGDGSDHCVTTIVHTSSNLLRVAQANMEIFSKRDEVSNSYFQLWNYKIIEVVNEGPYENKFV